MSVRIYFSLLIVFLFFGFNGFGQLSVDGSPWSFRQPFAGLMEVLVDPPNEHLIANLSSEDKEHLPYAFSTIVEVDYTPNTMGTWRYLDNGNRIWQLKLKSENALALGLYFENFELPEGVMLYLYGEQKKQVIGGFTHLNNRVSGRFATELIHGDEVTLELNVPDYVDDSRFFTIYELSYAFRGIEPLTPENLNRDFCEVNINCSPEGDDWQIRKKAVVRIKVKINSNEYWCTGSLVNNTKWDFTPYILTADHCAYKFGYATPEELEEWIFYFNYEAISCNLNTPAPGSFSIVGAETVANGGEQGNEGSDFYLVRLLDDIPDPQEVYFMGWSAEDVVTDQGVTIHHPGGDFKKISTFTQSPVTSGWLGNGLDSHWKVYWSETLNNWGVTEGGSSGSPLLGTHGLIMGTLTGGIASCNAPDEPDFYGKFSYHWESNGGDSDVQLKPWLDPINSGVTSLAGAHVGIRDHFAIQKDNAVIYPNPVQGNVTNILMKSPRFVQAIVIRDMAGSEVRFFQKNVFSKMIEVPVNGLNSGIYLVEIVSEGEVECLKLIVQK